MALAHSPSIVTDGLVLCLDAANTKSYPGSGSTWRTVSSTATVNDGNWKNLVWAKSGTSMVMYINGVQDSTHTLNTSVSGILVSFGSMWGPCNSDSYGAGTDYYSQCFIGSISILMVHFKQLALSEVRQNFNNLRNRFSL